MRICRAVLAVSVVATGIGLSSTRAERMSFLDNGSIRIGVDLDTGGTITFLARSGGGESDNLINTHDLGRQVQQSYYSGPSPFGKPHPGWKNWSWNPIGSGDVYGHPARVVEHKNDGAALYIKTIPMQWALGNVPGDCTFETWITLEGKKARIRNRLGNQRADKTQYAAHDQELPAVYTIGKLHRLITYAGNRPFEDQPLTQVRNSGPPWSYWKASENWAALVDDQDWGLGVIHPGVYSFVGGFHGKPNTGGSRDDPTGYIAPVRREILDHNIAYEYEYLIVLGALSEIRSAALAARAKDTRPDYRFAHDRQHWIYQGASDGGFPIEGCLRIKSRPGARDVQLIGPEQWWQAEQVPRLFVRAAFPAGCRRAAVLWSVPDDSFQADRRLALAIKPDGTMRTYEVNLAASPRYRGTITGLRLDLEAASRENAEVRIESISWKHQPKD
jgi:hypothetical protein